MSRCFPYPPPGYSRNGASYEALIESIKLQKDIDKAKAERKKEKRAKKEKKDKKEKRKGSEKSKLQKSLNEKTKELGVEHLEKSDLTEEHGQSVDSQKPSYSSDSTQNSNKRKRDDPVEPDGSNSVKPLKIRFFKKQKEPDFVKETSCSISGQSDQQNLSSQDARLNRINVPLVQTTSNSVGGQRAPLVSSNSKSRNPSASTSYDKKQSVLPSCSGRSILPSSKTELPVSLQTKKNDVAVHRSYRQQSIPIPDPSCRRPLEHEIPSSVLPPAPSVPRKNDATIVSSSGRIPIDKINVPINNEKEKGPISEIPLNMAPTRTQKKMLKKHSKYEKLIGSWAPPVIEAQVAAVDGGGDDDWLLGSRKTKTARTASLTNDVETCRESLWQPCARFLVEGDMYALPYTVPF